MLKTIYANKFIAIKTNAFGGVTTTTTTTTLFSKLMLSDKAADQTTRNAQPAKHTPANMHIFTYKYILYMYI